MMKRFVTKALATSLFFLLPLGAASCSPAVTLPTTSYEKVQFAFNGVEKSFQSRRTSKRVGPKARLAGSEDEALSSLFALFTGEDRKGTEPEELEYGQPPMVQFQCLKKVLEKVGPGYSFGTKYYDTIQGTVYVDMETGKKSSGDANKFDYAFIMGIDIAIDANDLINADVSFDITLSKGNETHHTQWYVNMELDYDMKSATPNYTLRMVNENDEVELPYDGAFTYEYDYVEVKDGGIQEWRKFCLGTSDRLVKDAAHSSFAQYARSEDFAYEVDCFAWYKGGVFYKNNDLGEAKALTFAESLFTGLRLNATDLNGDAFLSKQGTQNGAIKTIYREFCEVFGDDVLYDLVTKSDHGQHGPQGDGSLSLRATDASGRTVDTMQVRLSDVIHDLISGMSFLYLNKDGQEQGRVPDNDALTFRFALDGFDESVAVEQSYTIEEAYALFLLEVGPDPVTIVSLDSHLIFTDPQTKAMGSLALELFSDESAVSLVALDLTGKSRVEELEVRPEDFTHEVLARVLIVVMDENGEIVGSVEDQKTLELSFRVDGFAENETIFFGQDFRSIYTEYARRRGVDPLTMSRDCYLGFKLSEYNATGSLRIRYVAEEQEQSSSSIEDSSDASSSELSSQVIDFPIDSLCAVGSFNDWSLLEGFAEFERIDDGRFRLMKFYVMPGTEFKIVINHNWEFLGGLGYDDISNIADFPDVFEREEEHGNIRVTHEAVLFFTVAVGESIQIKVNVE